MELNHQVISRLIILTQTMFESIFLHNMLTYTTNHHHKEDRFHNIKIIFNTRMTKVIIILQLLLTKTNLCQMALLTFHKNHFNRNKTFSKISRWCNHINILKINHRIITLIFKIRMPKTTTISSKCHHSLINIILHKFKCINLTLNEEWFMNKVLESNEIISDP